MDPLSQKKTIEALTVCKRWNLSCWRCYLNREYLGELLSSVKGAHGRYVANLEVDRELREKEEREKKKRKLRKRKKRVLKQEIKNSKKHC